MKKHTFPIGLGTASIGRPQYINIRQEKPSDFSLDGFREKGFQVLDVAYKNGIRYFDTAPGYGMAEQLLIDWLVGKNDPTIEIATKWGYTYVANFDLNAVQHEIKEHSLSKLNEQWKQSKKLSPFLNIYQIHSATFETGVLENEEIRNRLAELKLKNKLLIGMTSSGFNQVEVIKRALEIEVEGMPLFDVFQVTYNVLDQSFADISNQIAKANKRIIVKEALANGRIFPNKTYSHYTSLYKKLKNLATKYEVGVDAVALRFCIDSIDIYKVLSGAANELHIFDNLKANQFELKEEEINELKQSAILPEKYWKERKRLVWN